MRVLVLDDDKKRLQTFWEKLGSPGNVIRRVMTSKECIQELEQWHWDTVFLDHDLGGNVMQESGEDTGYEVAQWIKDHPDHTPERVIIHSYNPSGSDAMKALLPGAEQIPGAWLMMDKVMN